MYPNKSRNYELVIPRYNFLIFSHYFCRFFFALFSLIYSLMFLTLLLRDGSHGWAAKAIRVSSATSIFLSILYLDFLYLLYLFCWPQVVFCGFSNPKEMKFT